MTRRRYGLQRNRQWLLPPAALAPARLTDDHHKAWAAFDIDAAIERQQLLRHAFGITTTIRAIPHE
jgi:hypothetical protein